MIEDIIELYATRGAAQYGGEAVSQLEHALQCAQLAEQAGAPAATVAACLLHDIGHLIDEQAPHEMVAAEVLERWLPREVTGPVALHVDAKRFLCQSLPGYWDSLSPASKESLIHQGGPFSDLEAARFLTRPYARESILLRRWDDLAKRPGVATPPLAHYANILSLASAGARVSA
jgi:phosphonate degradation associated HDIG domain protein